MAAAVPGLGMAATAAKYAKKGAKAVDAVKGGSKAGKGAKAAKADKPKPKPNAKQKKPSKKGGQCKKGKKKNSFVPGTKVLMADGSSKNIDDVKAGEWVLATDPESGDLQMRQVTDTITGDGVKHLVTLTVDPDGKDGKAKASTITATANHPFWLPDYGRWAEAGDLEPGMWLQTAAGTWIQITAIDDTHRTQRVHNLTVDGQHTYYVAVGAAAVLVHNAGCEPAEVTVRFQEGMSKTEFAKKANALQKLSDEGTLFKAPNPVARNSSVTKNYKGDLIRRVYDQYGSTNPGFADKLKDRILNRMDPDHVHELQLGGADTAGNLKMLDRFTNWHIGTQQIWPQIKNLDDYTPVKIRIEW
ncbi:HINT domain-containing protein [Streptomyces sp. TRM68367]|uniref:HINT domain-containing protein n=1 Tax=Streptomyces sp. TRM68367 TaxID=2758415 RepID=UPI0021CE40C1|nr:HINT domain-containing protein [Streptomyces sp. TRM68367]